MLKCNSIVGHQYYKDYKCCITIVAVATVTLRHRYSSSEAPSVQHSKVEDHLFQWQEKWEITSLVPRLLPAVQCWMLKSWVEPGDEAREDHYFSSTKLRVRGEGWVGRTGFSLELSVGHMVYTHCFIVPILITPFHKGPDIVATTRTQLILVARAIDPHCTGHAHRSAGDQYHMALWCVTQEPWKRETAHQKRESGRKSQK